MATKTFTEITSDLSDKPDADTVQFGWRGRTFEIDLTSDEQGKLEKLLQPYLDVARASRKGGRARSTRSSGANLGEVREWARANGFTVSDRGRVSQEVMDAYEAS